MPSIAKIIIACVSLQNAGASKLHPVIAAPPKEFLSDIYPIKNAFIKDAIRDQELFGYSDLHMDYTDRISERPIKSLSYQERPSYTKIKRTYDEKLDISKRPTYSPIKRTFDSIDNVFLNDVVPVPTKSNPKLHNTKISGAEKFESENLKKKSKPRKKILIKRFKSKSKTKKSRSTLEKILETLDLTPAEYLYLSKYVSRKVGIKHLLLIISGEKIKTEKKKKTLEEKIQSRRSISDSDESGSIRRHSVSGHNSLHGHSQVNHGYKRDFRETVYAPVDYEESQKMQFQIHGQEGPQSYRFGHDTGIGYNRQFRYEERDDYGVVKGRYGYYDQHGQLRIVNYSADPITGYHTDVDPVPVQN